MPRLYTRGDIRFSNNIVPTRLSDYVDADNIFSDELVADPANDYRLLPNSIAIDSGLDLSASIAEDLDGNPRPSGAAFDIGAYEYQH